MRQVFRPGDRVRGSFDSAKVVEVDGRRVLIEWDPVDAAGVDRGPGLRCWREDWTLTLLGDGDGADLLVAQTVFGIGDPDERELAMVRRSLPYAEARLRSAVRSAGEALVASARKVFRFWPLV